MNKTCQNCGRQVSESYVRVFAVDEDAGVETCPGENCDKVRRNGFTEDARAEGAYTRKRRQNYHRTTYDPDYGDTQPEATSDD